MTDLLLDTQRLHSVARAEPWASPDRYWPELSGLLADRPAPMAALNPAAVLANAEDLVRRAAGKPIRVASKSIRSRELLRAVLRLPGFAGVLGFTLAEALWLADPAQPTPVHDVVLGYPTVDRTALARLLRSDTIANITLMVDSSAHLDVIDAITPARNRPAVKVALELDCSLDMPWLRAAGLGRVGSWRSPVHSVADARRAAENIARRPGFDLVGVMGYESQIAGVADRPANRVRGIMLRALQKRSGAELLARRAAAVEQVRQVANLRFVNGGGTGSLELTAADPSVTEVTAGSGLIGPGLFDSYRSFSPAPALAFALDVCRIPSPNRATLLGGGWVASGAPGADRLPTVTWPPGLAYEPLEGAGEVQTPLHGSNSLRVGDRVWLRHAKAGELAERLNSYWLVAGGEVAGELATYRGEGRAFL